MNERRQWLKNILKIAGLCLASYPFLNFLSFERKRPPKQVRVRQLLKDGEHLVEPEFILFRHIDNVIAVSRKCTHLGCAVMPDFAQGVLKCPCHKSQFSLQGTRLSGPAEKDLPLFDVTLAEDGQGYIVAVTRV